MTMIRRRLTAAALPLLLLSAAAGAQETNTLGPESLKDFTLPGRRTTPPAETQPRPAPKAETPAETRPEPKATEPVRQRPAERAPAPARTAEPFLPPAVDVEPAPAADETAPLPQPESAPPTVATAPSSPDLDTLPPPLVPDPEIDDPSLYWPWIAAAGALALLLWGLSGALRRRREARVERVREAARADLGGALFAGGGAPKPEPAAPAIPEGPRPRLEVSVSPERAAATDDGATVNYALTISNRGDAMAGNIRIDARLFNAGAEADIDAFLAGPIHDQSGSPHVTIPPGGKLELNGLVGMPKSDVREVEVGGRRLFIPMLALNVAYDWDGGGTGRTSRAWLVGRRPAEPEAKMGAFRLDLGPRVYRSVAGREARLGSGDGRATVP